MKVASEPVQDKLAEMCIDVASRAHHMEHGVSGWHAWRDVAPPEHIAAQWACQMQYEQDLETWKETLPIRFFETKDGYRTKWKLRGQDWYPMELLDYCYLGHRVFENRVEANFAQMDETQFAKFAASAVRQVLAVAHARYELAVFLGASPVKEPG